MGALTGHTRWVLAHPKGTKALSNPYRTIERVAAAAGVTDWHFHDIRHTISTNLGHLRVAQEIIDRVMQHAVGSRMSRTYNQWEYVDQKREALEKWADHLETILGGEQPSVASFGSGGEDDGERSSRRASLGWAAGRAVGSPRERLNISRGGGKAGFRRHASSACGEWTERSASTLSQR